MEVDVVTLERDRFADAHAGHGEQAEQRLVAVRLERARVTLAGGDLRLEALKPPAGDGLEPQPRRDRHAPLTGRRDQRETLTPGLCEVEPDGPEAQPAGVAPTDRVFAIRMVVDAALDVDAAGGARSHRIPPCLGSPEPRRPPPRWRQLTES